MYQQQRAIELYPRCCHLLVADQPAYCPIIVIAIVIVIYKRNIAMASSSQNKHDDTEIVTGVPNVPVTVQRKPFIPTAEEERAFRSPGMSFFLGIFSFFFFVDNRRAITP